MRPGDHADRDEYGSGEEGRSKKSDPKSGLLNKYAAQVLQTIGRDWDGDMRIVVRPMEMLGRCRHEAGHAAMFWYVGNSFHEDHALILKTTETERLIDSFHADHSFTPKFIERIHRTKDYDTREMFRVQAENAILIFLGGPLAEFYFYGRPEKAFRREVNNPISDAARIREYLRALTGKDDKAYQIRLQDRAWDIIMEARTWSAINETADRLLKQRYLSGPEIEEIFEKSGAPQWYRMEEINGRHTGGGS